MLHLSTMHLCYFSREATRKLSSLTRALYAFFIYAPARFFAKVCLHICLFSAPKLIRNVHREICRVLYESIYRFVGYYSMCYISSGIRWRVLLSFKGTLSRDDHARSIKLPQLTVESIGPHS